MNEKVNRPVMQGLDTAFVDKLLPFVLIHLHREPLGAAEMENPHGETVRLDDLGTDGQTGIFIPHATKHASNL